MLNDTSLLVAELLETTNRQIQLLSNLIVRIQETSDRWADTNVASRETGIPANRIRYLARSNQIQSKRTGQRKLSVRLKDLESFSK
jgi:hypothetical protein